MQKHIDINDHFESEQLGEGESSEKKYYESQGLAPQRLVELREMVALIQQYVLTLPPDEAEAWYLYYVVGDVTDADVAAALEKSISTVKRLRRSGLDKIRQAFLTGAELAILQRAESNDKRRVASISKGLP